MALRDCLSHGEFAGDLKWVDSLNSTSRAFRYTFFKTSGCPFRMRSACLHFILCRTFKTCEAWARIKAFGQMGFCGE
jgi:hypothetical protein